MSLVDLMAGMTGIEAGQPGRERPMMALMQEESGWKKSEHPMEEWVVVFLISLVIHLCS